MYTVSGVRTWIPERSPYGGLEGLGALEASEREAAAEFARDPKGGVMRDENKGKQDGANILVSETMGENWKKCVGETNDLSLSAKRAGIRYTHQDLAKIAVSCYAEDQGSNPPGYTQAVIDELSIKGAAWYRDTTYLTMVGLGAAAGTYFWWRKGRKSRR